jgi:hypothetical protein
MLKLGKLRRTDPQQATFERVAASAMARASSRNPEKDSPISSRRQRK